ncbi:sucrose synthase [Chroococcidiopsis sp. TS-821]|uniref:sucrose synthase n=1 Tax=Chroococcidiopsis sp. TS-821 TaxID=1378066 RepID=UPI000CEDAB40|nr:sucrose synthase [Chroococcidiopsis sp. TS-821]PPS40994.1 sucrose synthase [Chroococcidiopsis sp. TS-821]
METLIRAVLESEEKKDFQQFIEQLSAIDRLYLLRNEILHAFANYCQEQEKPVYFFRSSAIGELIHAIHEMLLEDGAIWLMLRTRIASQECWWLSADLSQFKPVSVRALLDVRDRFVHSEQPQILKINFQPFHRDTPSIDDPRNIGQGLTFLNHYLCDQLSANPDYWVQALFQVLQRQEFDGIPLLIGDRISSRTQLHESVAQALKKVSQYPSDTPYTTLHPALQELGFEPGWGNTAGRVYETLELLDRLLTMPSPALLEAFVSRIPAFLRVVLVSIHGWVGQEEVLGRAETMGQVIYVLEQARHLEQQLQADVQQAGLAWLGIQPQVTILTRLIPNCEGTYCNQRVEKLEGTENGWILRVPFREFNPNVTQNWISKFEIWPYLESFALDAAPQLVKHFGGQPHLVIGHYSDGNLVSFLLARQFNAIQCNIAHSLEKSRYLFSDLYWQEFEPYYHFSAQFTADLISMNAADFIIASSYQEIVGTPDAIGQYESYKCFTMPQLYHVVDGINLFSPRFNVVPPGINEVRYFPYFQTELRSRRDRVRDLLFHRQDAAIFGTLNDVEKCPILAVGSVSQTNNQTGLIAWFGQSPELRDRCNLILITNKQHVTEASTAEEAREIEKLHALIAQYQLEGQIRWIGMQLNSEEVSEIYRAIADKRGIFINFARFEAFGRSVLEAMRSGLPVFATEFGGIAEIIQDGDNGYYINPTNFERTTEKILDFLNQCDTNPQLWQTISERAIQRIDRHCNWRNHVKQLLLFARIYGFWDYISRSSREALQCYLDALFHLLYKPRAAQILDEHKQR